MIPAGTFRMGCVSGSDDCYDDELPVHEVEVASFALSKHEVTRGAVRGVRGGDGLQRARGGCYPGGVVATTETGRMTTIRWCACTGTMRKSTSVGCVGRRESAIGCRASRSGSTPRVLETTTPWFWGDRAEDRCQLRHRSRHRRRLRRRLGAGGVGGVVPRERVRAARHGRQRRRNGCRTVGMTTTTAPRATARCGRSAGPAMNGTLLV